MTTSSEAARLDWSACLRAVRTYVARVALSTAVRPSSVVCRTARFESEGFSFRKRGFFVTHTYIPGYIPHHAGPAAPAVGLVAVGCCSRLFLSYSRWKEGARRHLTTPRPPWWRTRQEAGPVPLILLRCIRSLSILVLGYTGWLQGAGIPGLRSKSQNTQNTPKRAPLPGVEVTKCVRSRNCIAFISVDQAQRGTVVLITRSPYYIDVHLFCVKPRGISATPADPRVPEPACFSVVARQVCQPVCVPTSLAAHSLCSPTLLFKRCVQGSSHPSPPQPRTGTACSPLTPASSCT